MSKISVHIHTQDGAREADQMMSEIERQIVRVMEKAKTLEKHASRDNGPENKKSEQQLAEVLSGLKRI